MKRPTKAQFEDLVKVARGLGPLWKANRRTGRLELPGGWAPILIPPAFTGSYATPGLWTCTAGRNDGLVQYEAKTAREALKGAVRVLRRNAKRSATWADELEATVEVHRRRGLAPAPLTMTLPAELGGDLVVNGKRHATRPAGKGQWITVNPVVERDPRESENV